MQKQLKMALRTFDTINLRGNYGISRFGHLLARNATDIQTLQIERGHHFKNLIEKLAKLV